MWCKKIAIAFFTLFACAALSYAAVPKIVTYNGLLKNTAGSYLTGAYAMKFRIYTASTGGAAIWTETQSTVSVSSGRFSVQLGSVTPLNLDFSQDYWLSVEIGADGEMTPRQRLTSVGYAYMAEQVVNGFTQAQHDALSHKNVEGVKDNTAMIAKTNFKLDAYATASVNSMGDMVIDTFNDATGIDAAASSNYTWRGSPNYDVTTALINNGIDDYAKLVLHANGANGSVAFSDSSLSPKSITAVGDTKIYTAQSKFGGASAYFDGNGDYLSIPDSLDWALAGDFTIDAWIRFDSSNLASSNMIFTQTSNAGDTDFMHASWTGSQWYLAVKSGNSYQLLFTASDTLAANTWYHAAFVRSGNNWYIFRDGILKGSTTAAISLPDFSQEVRIGGINSAFPQYFKGYIDELRVSKGLARWTSNFTPPASEYSQPALAGTATVISNAWPEPVAPTEAMIISDETLNTGSITYYVSRDNGITWTLCPQGAVVNIATQPTGTQLKWKAVINGNAELNGIAIAV